MAEKVNQYEVTYGNQSNGVESGAEPTQAAKWHVLDGSRSSSQQTSIDDLALKATWPWANVHKGSFAKVRQFVSSLTGSTHCDCETT